MGSLSSLLVVSALAAAGGQAPPAPSQQSSEPASVSFVAEDLALAGIAYGIDAVDALPRVFGDRLSTHVSAGNRTVWYSCPNAPRVEGGSHLTFNFVGGRRYELVCRHGQDAEIRPSDEC